MALLHCANGHITILLKSRTPKTVLPPKAVPHIQALHMCRIESVQTSASVMNIHVGCNDNNILHALSFTIIIMIIAFTELQYIEKVGMPGYEVDSGIYHNKTRAP